MIFLKLLVWIVEVLKQGVEVPVGKSKRDWNYTHKALKDIVDAANTRTLAGFKGHQKPEDGGRIKSVH